MRLRPDWFLATSLAAILGCSESAAKPASGITVIVGPVEASADALPVGRTEVRDIGSVLDVSVPYRSHSMLVIKVVLEGPSSQGEELCIVRTGDDDVVATACIGYALDTGPQGRLQDLSGTVWVPRLKWYELESFPVRYTLKGASGAERWSVSRTVIVR
jgi:hypothetical protein